MRAAIDRYQPMVGQSSADSALRAELGQLYLSYRFAAKEIEWIFNVVIPAYNSALAIQRQLVREQPENKSFRADLGWTLVYAKLWHDISGIETNQPEAIAIFEGLVREKPEDPFARLGLAWALGLSIARSYPEDPATMVMSERRLALEQLVKEYPFRAEFRRDLANQLDWYARPGEGTSNDTARLARVSRANEMRAAILAGLEQADPAILAPSFPVIRKPEFAAQPGVCQARLGIRLVKPVSCPGATETMAGGRLPC